MMTQSNTIMIQITTPLLRIIPIFIIKIAMSLQPNNFSKLQIILTYSSSINKMKVILQIPIITFISKITIIILFINHKQVRFLTKKTYHQITHRDFSTLLTTLH